MPVLFKPSHGLRILRNEAGARLLAQGGLHLPQAARRGRRHRHQPHRRAIAGGTRRTDRAGGRSSFPACRCCASRPRPGRASRHSRHCWIRRAALAARSSTSTTTPTPRAKPSWAGSTAAVQVTRQVSRSRSTSCCWTWSPGLQASLAGSGAEVAHLKAIGLADGTFGVANLVSSGTKPELSLPSRIATSRGRCDRQCPRGHRPGGAGRAGAADA